jgi:ribonuclease HI
MQRNKTRHGDPQTPVNVSVRWSLDTAFDLWQLCMPPKERKQMGTKTVWRPPQEGWIKCNTDAAFYPHQGHGATGAVLRDGSGLFVGGRAQWYPHGLDALTLEALACRDGVALARSKGVSRLILETDSQEFVKLWKDSTTQRSRIVSIIRETREISLCFADFSIFYISRSCNRVAHTLAKQVSDDNRLGEWQLAPACVDHLLTHDCNPVDPNSKSQKKKDLHFFFSNTKQVSYSIISYLRCCNSRPES